MKSTKQLKDIYMDAIKRAKIKESEYSFESFKQDTKALLKDIKSENMVFGLKVSASGMTRKFNSFHHNLILNLLYNDKYSYEAVKVVGCGMDMGFHLLLTCTSALLTRVEMDKEVKSKRGRVMSWNLLCSNYSVL